jgi:UDP-N-acetylmuramoyl-L-alanyl-D-glutamate--2,6-diaminopimelate ligase
LTAGINIIERSGPEDPEITALVWDSRDAGPGSLFFALKGVHTDGHAYIDQAVAAGAAAVVHSDPLAHSSPGVLYLRVEDTRRAMSPAAAALYDDPSREMTVIGVTGTDGKSTTVSFIHQLLRLGGLRAGFLSTVQFDLGDGAQKNSLRQSTPEAPEVQRILRAMRDAGCSHAVVEATSHGLSPQNNRLGDVAFDVGVLTNISREHLEFHKTFERYMDDKANLFRALSAKGAAVINRDEPNRGVFESASSAPVVHYSLSGAQEAGLAAERITEEGDRQRFHLRCGEERLEAELSMPGRFNVENSLAALLAVSRASGARIGELAALLPQLKPVKGRMVPVDCGQPFRVLVDYAHTPGAFEKLFPMLRDMVAGRLIPLFSSAGERDLEKRPVLGEIADRYCEVIILADEDPRGEEPMAVLRDVARGCRGKSEGQDLLLIPDRRAAIRRAFELARPEDMVLLLGKGHEGSIIYADGAMEWDEEREAIRILEELGYRCEAASASTGPAEAGKTDTAQKTAGTDESGGREKRRQS